VELVVLIGIGMLARLLVRTDYSNRPIPSQ
jgi:hypothetical protein